MLLNKIIKNYFVLIILNIGVFELNEQVLLLTCVIHIHILCTLKKMFHNFIILLGDPLHL